MKRRNFTLLLAIMASIGTMFAEVYSGKCGDSLTWSLNTEDSTLVIEGSGEMVNYYYDSPWNDYRSYIKYVSLPDNLPYIGDCAFSYCFDLTSIEIPNSVSRIGFAAFFDCRGLKSLSIPDGINNIGGSAFCGCSKLTSVTIPQNVSFIGSSAFASCDNLTDIHVATDNNSYSSVNGVLFNKDLTKLVSYPAGKNDAYSIPGSVTYIEIAAFRGCEGLTSVTIPNSVNYIDWYAFKYCSGLTAIYNYAATPQIINSNVYYAVDMTKCTLYVLEESVALYKDAEVWKDFANIQAIPEPEIPSWNGESVVTYIDKDDAIIDTEVLTFHVPEAPQFAGFTFLKWIASSDNLQEGITIQAVYTYNGDPMDAPEIYTTPANKAQKLLRQGNIYILTDDSHTYTLTGQHVK